MQYGLTALSIVTVSLVVTAALLVATPWALDSFVTWTHTLPSAVARSLPIALPILGAAVLATAGAYRYSAWSGSKNGGV